LKPRWKIVIIAIILAATITLASLSYFWLTLGDVTTPRTPVAALSKTNVTHGVRFSFISTEKEITWSQIRIYVTEGMHIGIWQPSKRDFAGQWGDVTVVYRNITLGENVIGCEIHDINRIGIIGGGDSFTVFGSAGLYLVTLFYEPTDGACYQDAFFIPIH